MAKVLVFPKGSTGRDNFVPMSELVELDIELVEMGLVKIVIEAKAALQHVVRHRGQEVGNKTSDLDKARDIATQLYTEIQEGLTNLDRAEAALGAIREIQEGVTR